VLALALLLAAASPPKHAEVHAQLRGAYASIVLTARGDLVRSLEGAVVTYSISELVARATMPNDDSNIELAENGLRLVDVTGLNYPLLFVLGMACGRECTPEPTFYQFDPGGPTLRALSQSDLNEVLDAEPVGSCVTIEHPQLLYVWTSEISLTALAGGKPITYGYFAVTKPEPAVVIKQLKRVKGDVPAAYEAQISPLRLTRAKENGAERLSPCPPH
jgi:hypothetical protein